MKPPPHQLYLRFDSQRKVVGAICAVDLSDWCRKVDHTHPTIPISWDQFLMYRSLYSYSEFGTFSCGECVQYTCNQFRDE